MEEVTRKELFLASLGRCASSEDFLSSFYDRFLSSSDDVRAKFQNTDFARQNKMLLRSLKLTAAATVGDPAGLRELRDRAETHDRHHLNIQPPLYELWRTALIETARRYDPEWNAVLEDAWHKILGYVIQHMIRYY